jgi:predicted nucleic acid-binding protein
VKRLRVDANVLLRFLTGDPKDLAERVARLMVRAERGEVVLVLSPLVVAEMVWVLKSVYRRSYEEIAQVLIPLLSAVGLEAEDREVVIEALELTRMRNVDFLDAILSLQAVREDETVCTFDKTDFKRLPAKWFSPD